MKVSTGLSVNSGAVSVTYGTAANTALQGNQTLLKLNNANKTAASPASFYAPTAGGTAGYVLIGAGTTTAPAWHAGLTLSGTAAESYAASFTGTTDSSSSATGAVKIAGGLGVAKAIYSDGNIITSALIGSIGAGEHYLEAQNSTYGNILRVDVSSDGKTAGIWSSGYVNSSGTYTADGKWLIYRNTSGDIATAGSLYISGSLIATSQIAAQGAGERYCEAYNSTYLFPCQGFLKSFLQAAAA